MLFAQESWLSLAAAITPTLAALFSALALYYAAKTHGVSKANQEGVEKVVKATNDDRAAKDEEIARLQKVVDGYREVMQGQALPPKKPR